MFERIQELRNRRMTLVNEARAILDLETDERSLTAEEVEQYDRIMGEVDQLGDQVQREERLAGLEGTFGAGAQAGGQGDAGEGDAGEGDTDDRTNPRATEDYRNAFSNWLARGSEALSADEYRTMQADDDVGGGYLIAPQQMVSELLKKVDDLVVIRQLATVHPLETAASLGVVTLEEDVDDWDWTTELRTGTETELGFGKRELRPHPLAKRVKISNTLLRKSTKNPEELVRERLAHKLGVTQEKAFMTGDGNQKPLGLFIKSKDGIYDRDVSEGNKGTSIMPDGLIEAKFALKQQYWAKARWIFHRDAIKQIRKLKDGEGQYIWQPGITGGAPDRILELPYIFSEFAPNNFSSGKYVGILGDFTYYWIADALDMQIQRLVELYAETNQTGFIGRYEGDGMPVLEEAFVRVKLP